MHSFKLGESDPSNFIDLTPTRDERRQLSAVPGMSAGCGVRVARKQQV